MKSEPHQRQVGEAVAALRRCTEDHSQMMVPSMHPCLLGVIIITAGSIPVYRARHFVSCDRVLLCGIASQDVSASRGACSGNGQRLSFIFWLLVDGKVLDVLEEDIRVESEKRHSFSLTWSRQNVGLRKCSKYMGGGASGQVCM